MKRSLLRVCSLCLCLCLLLTNALAYSSCQEYAESLYWGIRPGTEESFVQKVDKIIKDNIKKGMSDYEKALTLHDYVVSHADYSYETIRLEDPEDKYYASDIILDGTGVCQAYTYALDIMLHTVGLKTAYNYGTNHVWNLVEMDGDWYNIDATWDDRNNGDENGIGGDFNHQYFGVTTEALQTISNHECENDEGIIAEGYKDNYAYQNGELDQTISYATEAIQSSLTDGNVEFEVEKNGGFTFYNKLNMGAVISALRDQSFEYNGQKVYPEIKYDTSNYQLNVTVCPKITDITTGTPKGITNGVRYSWKVSTKGSSGTIQYQYILMKNGSEIKSSDWTTASSYSYDATENADYNISVRVRDDNGTSSWFTLQSAAFPKITTPIVSSFTVSEDKLFEGQSCSVSFTVENDYFHDFVYRIYTKRADGCFYYFGEETSETSVSDNVNTYGSSDVTFVLYASVGGTYFDHVTDGPTVSMLNTPDTWVDYKGDRYYIGSYGYRLTNQWKYEDDLPAYYFDADGKMMTGIQTIDNRTYILDQKTGKLQTGWVEVNGAQCYANPYIWTNGIFNIDDKLYGLDNTGAIITGKYTDENGITYIFDQNGCAQTGWIQYNNQYYYAHPDYAYLYTGGLYTIDDKLYGLDDTGAALSGMYTFDDYTYIFDQKGCAQTGWIQYNSKYYYASPSCSCLYTGGFYSIDDKLYGFDDTGVIITGKYTSEYGATYIFDQNGCAQTGWIQYDNRYYYADPDYSYLYTSGAYLIDGKIHFFSETGSTISGRYNYNGSDIFLNTKGEPVTGWIKDAEGYYYVSDNADPIGYLSVGGVYCTLYPYSTGWETISGKYYHFDSNGLMQTGWIKDDGQWYYLNEQGDAAIGWKQIDQDWYRFNASGVMQTGIQAISGKAYFFRDSGKMQTGWWSLPGAWHYSNSDGTLQTGWKQINGTWYWFDANGVMATGWRQIGKSWYYFAGSGAMVTGWLPGGGHWYYMDGSGAMRTGWLQSGSAWYWLDASGIMATGTRVINGVTHSFSGNGVWQGEVTVQSGWKQENGQWFYYTNGSKATGWKLINGFWYYFSDNGVMISNTTMTIGGISYTFNSNGAMQ